jgi:translocation and assembly module TamA
MPLPERVDRGRGRAEVHPGERANGIVEEVPIADAARRLLEHERECSLAVRSGEKGQRLVQRIVAARTLVKGRRLEHAAYEKVKSDLQLAAATYGYLDARLLRNELQVDPLAHRANVFLELDSGERYRFGVTTLDQSAIRDSQLRRYLRYQQGDPYEVAREIRVKSEAVMRQAGVG